MFKNEDGCKSFIEKSTFCQFLDNNFGPKVRGKQGEEMWPDENLAIHLVKWANWRYVPI